MKPPATRRFVVAMNGQTAVLLQDELIRKVRFAYQPSQIDPAHMGTEGHACIESHENVTLGNHKMRMVKALAVAAMLLGGAAGTPLAKERPAEAPSIAVGPQYDSTHVYVAPEDLDRFTATLVATFGGTKSQPAVFTVTPTPSQTTFEFVFTPVGTFSVFGFKTPIPYPFGEERTGYLVTDMDSAVRSAKAHGADIVVAPFPDPIGRDAIIEWPGGVHMQLYWHTTAPNYAKLQSIPENRVYVSAGRVDEFVRDFVAFSRGKVVSDDGHARASRSVDRTIPIAACGSSPASASSR
jgi:predicted enzyme related to lactoylglutathione lyase